MAYFAKNEMFRQLCRITSRNYYPTQGRGLHQSSTMQSKVAVVLSGSGVFDGSEVHESSAVLVHLSRREADISIFAPDIQQMHVIDHSKGEPTNESRNVLAESARIARGKISSLTSLTATNYDAVIFPGGFGAAKNLSSFATEGSNCTVHSEVERVLKEFHAAKRPIGLCCIAPVLVAKVIPGCEITIGQEEEDGGRWPYAGTATAIREMGATHVAKNVTDTHIDEKNLIVTSPAFMCETHFHEVFDGIGEMVKKVLSLAS